MIAAACAALLVTAVVGAQQPAIEAIPVRGHIYLIGGAGSNITVSAGPDGVFLVDSGAAANADKVIAAIKSLQARLQLALPAAPRAGAETATATNLEPFYRTLAPPKPIRYLANTSALADHVGGNEKISLAGKTYTGGNVTGEIGGEGEKAAILAHENVLVRMSAPTGQQAPFPQAALPTDTYFTKKKDLFFNGEAIEILHEPSAHTDGDSIVFFRKSDVITAGDLYVTGGYPFIDLSAGGNVQGIVGGLNRIVDMCIPVYGQEGGTMVIPGHGRLSDVGDVINFREMVTIVRDRVQDMVKKNMTLEQVKAAKPTRDYDTLYSAPGAFITGDAFVEAVYRSLKK